MKMKCHLVIKCVKLHIKMVTYKIAKNIRVLLFGPYCTGVVTTITKWPHFAL